MSNDPAAPPTTTPGAGATAAPATPAPAPAPAAAGVPSRRVVATYTAHQDAVRAVDWLSDEGFPVQRVAIVGRDLRSVEQVTGRVTTGRAAGQGATQGAIIGFFFALLFGIFFAGPGFLGLLVYAVVMAAVFGAILGALGHAALGGTRDFGTIAAMQAGSYELLVDEAAADEAESVLARLPQVA